VYVVPQLTVQLFYFFPGPKYVHRQKKGHYWKKRLASWFTVIIKKRKLVILISSIVVVVSFLGMIQMESDNYLMDDLKPNEPLKQDFNYLDAHYGGVRPFELAVTVKDTSKSVWDNDILYCVDSVETYLKEVYEVQIKTSLVNTMKVLNRGGYSGMAEYFELPERKGKMRTIKRIVRSEKMKEFVRLMVDSTEQIMRISGAIPDMGNRNVRAKNEALFRFLETKKLNGALEYQITGTAHLIDKNMNYLASSLVKGLAVSILIVALIIGLIYRSWTILVISIITNVIPLLFIAGVMGYLGVELKTSTAIIFTIAFGIAVDDTIHFLGKFKFELMKGKGKLYALKRSYMTTGKAMILTTLILCSGFCLLVLSSFLGTFYLGVMLSIALFVALIADLTLLPVLLLLFYKPDNKRAKL